MYKKIIQALFEAKISSSINESYATVKDRFIRDGADELEVKSILDLHKKLKDMRRLKDDEINIDVLAKGKSFDEFKTLMAKYSEKDTATKTDKFNELKNNIVAENNEWIVYKIDTAEEAYLFHGLTKWCIVSGSKTDAEEYFNKYVFKQRSNFYFIVRNELIGDNWDYIALQLQEDDKTYWDKEDKSYRTLPEELNIPKLTVKYKPLIKSIPKTWKLNSDGSYDVNDDVNLKNFEQFVDSDGKLTTKFNKVTGSFDCLDIGLTSLEGCPKEVGGDFDCSKNKLTSLKGCPEKVEGGFYCYDNNLSSLEGAPKEVGRRFNCGFNKLISLEGSPKEVGGTFDCACNNLTSLKGAPEKVGGDFNCGYNNLTSLKGCPEKVGDNFNCSENKLTSLEGCPKEVDGHFNCGHNNLTSLKGCPEKVGVGFDCSYNQLTSLEGCPKEVGRYFHCKDNKGKQFTKSDIENICKVKYGREYIRV